MLTVQLKVHKGSCPLSGRDGRRSTLLAPGAQDRSQHRHQVAGSAAEEPQVTQRPFTFAV